MKSSFKIFLKANERIFINGAVIRVDRKVSLELLNDVPVPAGEPRAAGRRCDDHRCASSISSSRSW